MFQVRKRLRGTLSLRDRHAHIGKIYAIIKVLKKLTEFSMPKMKASI
ncbi:hypothetical protein [Candidatus Enterovibrio altilux]|nr:hypothetical protein [Candidatus Enterovibrio luxaltus]